MSQSFTASQLERVRALRGGRPSGLERVRAIRAGSYQIPEGGPGLSLPEQEDVGDFGGRPVTVDRPVQPTAYGNSMALAAAYGATPVQAAAAEGARQRAMAEAATDPFAPPGVTPERRAQEIAGIGEREAGKTLNRMRMDESLAGQKAADEAASRAGFVGRLGASLEAGVGGAFETGMSNLERLSGRAMPGQGPSTFADPEMQAIADRADPLTKMAAGLATYPVQLAANPVVEIPSLLLGGAAGRAVSVGRGTAVSEATEAFLKGLATRIGPRASQRVIPIAHSIMTSTGGLSAMSAASAAGNYPNWETDPEGGLRAMQEAAIHGAGLGLGLGVLHGAANPLRLSPAVGEGRAPAALENVTDVAGKERGPLPELPQGRPPTPTPDAGQGAKRAAPALRMKELGVNLTAPEAKPAEKNLLGDTVVEPATGRQGEMVFETESKIKRPARTGDDATIAAKFDEEATPTFDTLRDEDEGGGSETGPEPEGPIPDFEADIRSDQAKRSASMGPGDIAGPPKEAMGAAAGRTLRPRTVGGVAQLVSGVRQKVSGIAREIAGHAAPKTTAASLRSGNALVRHASAEIAAPHIARDMVARVVGPARMNDAEFLSKLGSVLVEDRLRAIRQGFLDAASEAETPEAAAALQQQAKDVHTLIGGGGAVFKTEADFQAALADPEIKQAVDLHKQVVQPYTQLAHEELGGRLAGAGQNTGAFVNLKPIDANTPDGPPVERTRQGNLANALKKKSRFNVRATGSSQFYAVDYGELVKHAVTGNIKRATLDRLYKRLVKDKLAVLADPGQEFTNPDGSTSHYPLIGGKPALKLEVQRMGKPRYTAGGQQGATTEIQNLWVRRDLYDEVRGALNVDSSFKTPALVRLADTLNTIQMAGPTDFVFHVSNILSAVIGSPGGRAWWTNLVRKVPAVNVLDGIGRVAVEIGNVVRDSPEIRARIAKLAATGAIRGGEHGGITGKMIGVIDQAGRLALDRLYQSLVDRGLVKASERGRREFINQVGQYNSRLQGKIMRAAKEAGLSPFIVAGRNFNRLGWRRLFMSPGVKAASPKAWAQMRALEIAGTVLAVAVIPAAFNYITVGQATGRKGVPLGAIDTGASDAKGDPVYVDPLKWIGLRRGLRVSGVGAIAEGIRNNEPASEYFEKAASDIVQGVLHPWAGPAVDAAAVAATGRSAAGYREAPVVKPGENQYAQNIRTAVGQLNPLVGAFIEGHHETGTIGGGAKQIVKSLGGAAGIQSKGYHLAWWYDLMEKMRAQREPTLEEKKQYRVLGRYNDRIGKVRKQVEQGQRDRESGIALMADLARRALEKAAHVNDPAVMDDPPLSGEDR